MEEEGQGPELGGLGGVKICSPTDSPCAANLPFCQRNFHRSRNINTSQLLTISIFLLLLSLHTSPTSLDIN